MTIPVQTPLNLYVGDGAQDTFAFTFRILQADDLVVTVDAVLQIESVDYDLANVTELGGDVVFQSGSIPSNASTIQLKRETEQDQTTEYDPFDPFPAKTHELGLDKLTMLIQEVEAITSGGAFDPDSDQVITGDWAFTEIILGTCSGNLVIGDLTPFTVRSVAEVISAHWVFNNGITLNGGVWPSDVGSNGQVLGTDGAGALFWTSVAGGGGFDPSDDQTITGVWNFQTELNLNAGLRLANDQKFQGAHTNGDIFSIFELPAGNRIIIMGQDTDLESVQYRVEEFGRHPLFVGGVESGAFVGAAAGGLLVRTPDNIITERRVGYRNPGNRTFVANDTLTQNDEGGKVSTATASLNLDIPQLQKDTIITVKNVSVGSLNLLESGVTLRHLQGGAAAFGDRLLGTFSVCTLEWVEFDQVDVYGNGIL